MYSYASVVHVKCQLPQRLSRVSALCKAPGEWLALPILVASAEEVQFCRFYGYDMLLTIFARRDVLHSIEHSSVILCKLSVQ